MALIDAAALPFKGGYGVDFDHLQFGYWDDRTS